MVKGLQNLVPVQSHFSVVLPPHGACELVDTEGVKPVAGLVRPPASAEWVLRGSVP